MVIIGGAEPSLDVVYVDLHDGSLFMENATVQILPFDAGSYPATGPFTILGFPEQKDPDVVRREGLTDSVYIENATDVSMYNKAFGLLRALALGPERSASLMRDILKEHDR
ncbi:Scr1 family TA system antitoxin-like transcriptional regulator [Streptomyces sp. NBC_01423]|uniref:Scr1 family TA system antitoxin-like transcriptional regulator n=1 Tax=Streptomyces sp. NBC_01423 TaxID=2903860 RepID=UPI002E2B3D12|nr:Scr1 family TA system antitoxin-like transcriptional regulator [Streptomyces sp. NBC_01423]